MHSTNEELKAVLDKAKAQVQVGNRYYHYKHHDEFYTVISVALNEETQQPAVVYALDAEPEIVWIRPLESFLGDVYVDGRKTKRFTLVNQA